MSANIQRNLSAFGEINDELVTPHPKIVHESILVAASMANLHHDHATARNNIISALDARLDGRPASMIHFAQLTTMMIFHHPQVLLVTPLISPHHSRPFMYDAMTFATLLKDVVTVLVHTNAASSAPPCRTCQHHGKGIHFHFHHSSPHKHLGLPPMVGGRGSLIGTPAKGRDHVFSVCSFYTHTAKFSYRLRDVMFLLTLPPTPRSYQLKACDKSIRRKSYISVSHVAMKKYFHTCAG
jgi:hypothetical protein